MKTQSHVPDDPTPEDFEAITAALPHNADITTEMVEDAVYQFLKDRSPIMLRALRRHLRDQFTDCVRRIKYPTSKGRNALITIEFNKKLAREIFMTTNVTLRVSWRVEPMFSPRFVKDHILDIDAYAAWKKSGKLP
jgi:hypothetical protein